MSPRMLACPACSHHVLVSSTECPHCGASISSGGGKLLMTAGAAMLGLTLGAGCDKPQPDYGVPDTGTYTDNDGDGYSEAEGDCDETKADIHPGATETPGDGVESK